MNRNDWLLVGMRLFGLYLLVEGVLSLPAVFTPAATAMLAGFPWAFSSLILAMRAGLTLLLGAVLFIGAPSIQRWLVRKDERAELAEDSLQPDRPSVVD